MLRIIITGRNSTLPAFPFSGIPNSGAVPASAAGGTRYPPMLHTVAAAAPANAAATKELAQ